MALRAAIAVPALRAAPHPAGTLAPSFAHLFRALPRVFPPAKRKEGGQSPAVEACPEPARRLPLTVSGQVLP
jgi:hypothetical protein